MDRTVDQALYMIFFFQGLLCSLCAVGNSWWARRYAALHWYLGYTQVRGEDQQTVVVVNQTEGGWVGCAVLLCFVLCAVLAFQD